VTSAIHILNGLPLESEKLNKLAEKVKGVFGIATNIVPSPLKNDRAFDRSRGQYNSTALLALLLNQSTTPNIKRILIVDVDLFIPVLTFVFGEAQLSGVAAIVSTHRLQNHFYGIPRNDASAMERLEKEVIHELGHTFGLYHCRQFECVMRSSTYVEEIDLKKAEPCGSCSALLRQTLQPISVCIKPAF
jgi:Predicted Zn-dependent proteases